MKYLFVFLLIFPILIFGYETNEYIETEYKFNRGSNLFSFQGIFYPISSHTLASSKTYGEILDKEWGCHEWFKTWKLDIRNFIRIEFHFFLEVPGETLEEKCISFLSRLYRRPVDERIFIVYHAKTNELTVFLNDAQKRGCLHISNSSLNTGTFFIYIQNVFNRPEDQIPLLNAFLHSFKKV